MDKLDIFYRALIDFRKNTLENAECARQRKAIARADEDGDIIEVEKTECTIDDDWIDEIETGLEAVGRAIAEERQFILSNGEVIPIENVKNVSKESVEHLARHSDLITKMPDKNGNLIPDKLYSVEKLTDFAVYENRFLYMLLCYLKDFISVRYNAILELTTTYIGKVTMQKTIHTGNRHSVYNVFLDEKIRNDEFLLNNNPSKKKIDRIDGLLKAVLSYLATPLMDEVAKAPMLKPPITETNVLKMNRNFKAAVKLYYYVTSYTKDGYTYSRNLYRINPFKEQTADEFAETVELTSFLTYQYGMGIQDILRANYQDQLRLEKKQAEQKKIEQLKSLKRRIKDSGQSPEEYMLLLEERNKTLEADGVLLSAAREEIVDLKKVITQKDEHIETLNLEIEHLNSVILEKEAEIVKLTEEYEQKISELTAEYERNIRELSQKHADEIKALNAEHAQKIVELTEEWKQKLNTESQKHSLAMEELRLSADKERKTLNEKISGLTKEYAARGELLKSIEEKLQATEESIIRKDAKINALKKQSGLFSGDEDYTSREGFDDLERQYNAIKAEFDSFKTLYNEQWKLTKKDIRKKYLKPTPSADKQAAEGDVAVTETKKRKKGSKRVAEVESQTEVIENDTEYTVANEQPDTNIDNKIVEETPDGLTENNEKQ